jgi:hypothetical protein
MAHDSGGHADGSFLYVDPPTQDFGHVYFQRSASSSYNTD